MLPGQSQNIFQERLNRLFDDRRVTYRDVVKGTGYAIQEVYLWKLRAGRASNPSYKIIEALAQYFNVPPGYFFGDENRDDLSLLITRLDEHGRKIVRRIITNVLGVLSSQPE